jgi:hypothetical protein
MAGARIQFAKSGKRKNRARIVLRSQHSEQNYFARLQTGRYGVDFRGEFSMGSDNIGESMCSVAGVTRGAQPIHRIS